MIRSFGGSLIMLYLSTEVLPFYGSPEFDLGETTMFNLKQFKAADLMHSY
jgi:hypothetical protein